MKLISRVLRLLGIPLLGVVSLGVGGAASLLATCGPFTDTANDGFCPAVLEVFILGITTGTTATTYSPKDNVTRLQMAAFLSRTVDGTLRRASQRTIAGQFWTPQSAAGLTTIGNGQANGLAFDGADLWVASNSIYRVRASDGKVLETWGGSLFPQAVVIARGRVFITGEGGNLFQIDPRLPAGNVTTVASNLGFLTYGLAFDGSRLWTANNTGSVSIVTPGPSIPWTVTTVTTGFSGPRGMLYDGANVWVTQDAGRIAKLDSSGGILQTVTTLGGPSDPTYDGTNLWIPLHQGVSVVRSSSGAVLAR